MIYRMMYLALVTVLASIAERRSDEMLVNGCHHRTVVEAMNVSPDVQASPHGLEFSDILPRRRRSTSKNKKKEVSHTISR